jgi:hypothetical protein
VSGLTLHGGLLASRRGGSAAVFDPATLSLSGWWRAAFSAVPWTGTASAGSSGSRDLATLGADPSVGATLNGLAGADFATSKLTTSLAGTSLLTDAAFSFWFLVRADTVIADPGPGLRWQADGLFDDTGATYVQCTLHAGGCTLSTTASGGSDELTTAFSTGTPHLVQGSFDGTNLELQVDSAAKATMAASMGPGATIDDLSTNIRIGLTAYGNLDGRLWDIGFRQAAANDTDRANIRAYVNSRYALAL